jgi:hypothetical protein
MSELWYTRLNVHDHSHHTQPNQTHVTESKDVNISGRIEERDMTYSFIIYGVVKFKTYLNPTFWLELTLELILTLLPSVLSSVKVKLHKFKPTI